MPWVERLHFRVRAVPMATVSRLMLVASDTESVDVIEMSDITILLSSISMQALHRPTVMEFFGPRGPTSEQAGLLR